MFKGSNPEISMTCLNELPYQQSSIFTNSFKNTDQADVKDSILAQYQ